jgi:hypothetical protein
VPPDVLVEIPCKAVILIGSEKCLNGYQGGSRCADTFRKPLIGGSPFVTSLL